MEDNISALDGAKARAPDDASSQANWKRIYIATWAFLLAIEALLVYYGSELTMLLILPFTRDPHPAPDAVHSITMEPLLQRAPPSADTYQG